MIDGHYTLAIPAQHPCYAGHFPAKAVVPAALLLQWLQEQLEAAAPGCQLVRINSIKFLQVVEPADQLALVCREQTGGKLTLRVLRGDTLVCKGSVQIQQSAKQ